MLTPAQADELIGRHLPCLPVESLPVSHCAGAVLRENIYAERDQPPFDRVAMDGIAVSAAHAMAARTLRVQGTQAAGDPPRVLESPLHCIEIMTGAMLPAGCDAVVPVERIHCIEGKASVEDGLVITAGMNIHSRGSDLKQGALIVSAGIRLESPQIAAAAGAGMVRLRVSQQPSFMVVSTGNELVEPGEPIQAWQLRRSNAYGVAAALRRRGFARVADDHLPDDAAALREHLHQHLQSYSVLVLSGGVSMGKFDLVPAALAACGVQQVFHKVLQRPGKPFWFGTAPNGTAVFALPGNPVSTLVCLTRYVIPAIDRAMGLAEPQAVRIALGESVTFNMPLTGFLPVATEIDEWARPWARPVPHNGSGDFSALAGTCGFVELPPGPNTYAKGFVTKLYRW